MMLTRGKMIVNMALDKNDQHCRKEDITSKNEIELQEVAQDPHDKVSSWLAATQNHHRAPRSVRFRRWGASLRDIMRPRRINFAETERMKSVVNSQDKEACEDQYSSSSKDQHMDVDDSSTTSTPKTSRRSCVLERQLQCMGLDCDSSCPPSDDDTDHHPLPDDDKGNQSGTLSDDGTDHHPPPDDDQSNQSGIRSDGGTDHHPPPDDDQSNQSGIRSDDGTDHHPPPDDDQSNQTGIRSDDGTDNHPPPDNDQNNQTGIRSDDGTDHHPPPDDDCNIQTRQPSDDGTDHHPPPDDDCNIQTRQPSDDGTDHHPPPDDDCNIQTGPPPDDPRPQTLPPPTGDDHNLHSDQPLQPLVPYPCSDQSDESPAENTRSRGHFFNKNEEKDRKKHPMLPSTCGPRCKGSCRSFSEADREVIWQELWQLDYNQRRAWIGQQMSIMDCNTRRRHSSGGSPSAQRRKVTRSYSLPLQGQDVQVCLKFFLKTLGYTTDRVVVEAAKSLQRSPINAVSPDARGSAPCAFAKDKSVIIGHIESFNPQMNHYRREHAPNVRYISREITFQMMYDDFCQKHPNYCGREVYRQTMKDMHISNKMPKMEKCEVCEKYKNMQEPTSQETAAYLLHKAKADEAKAKYDLDMDTEFPTGVACYAMDMQKVLLLPRMPTSKEAFFTSRMVVFNETYAKVGKHAGKSQCVIWNESIAGRNAEEVASSVHKIINLNRDAKTLILWADNCGPQNKNYTLFTMLSTLINSPDNSCNCIILRYLTKGHTHNAADGIHGNIEQKMKAVGDIYDYTDFLNVVERSRKNMGIVSLQPGDFRDWPNAKKNWKKTPVLLTDVVEVEFRRGDKTMHVRTRHGQPQLTVDFLKPKHKLVIPRPRQGPRGLAFAKKVKIIQKLTPYMPLSRRTFWANLPESNVNDLCTFME